MKGFPYELRLRLSDDVHEDGQLKVMGRIPVFDGAEVTNFSNNIPEKKNSFKCAVLNMEHGCRNDEIIPFIQTNEYLKDTDILFASELDDGTYRSGNIDSARVIAERMGFNYAYGLEFIELADERDEKGYEGNAVLSRYPIVRATSIHLPAAYEWYDSEQKRIGLRVAVFAEIDFGEFHIGAVSVHLENRTGSDGRVMQMKLIAEKAKEFFGDIPVVMGGDYNFLTFNELDKVGIQKFIDEYKANDIRDTDKYEKSFDLMTEYGYNYKDFNGNHLFTCRDKLLGEPIAMHLDWIFAKGLTCLGNGMVSTLTEDCKKWAPADSPIHKYTGVELSDHNAVWATCQLK